MNNCSKCKHQLIIASAYKGKEGIYCSLVCFKLAENLPNCVTCNKIINTNNTHNKKVLKNDITLMFCNSDCETKLNTQSLEDLHKLSCEICKSIFYHKNLHTKCCNPYCQKKYEDKQFIDNCFIESENSCQNCGEVCGKENLTNVINKNICVSCFYSFNKSNIYSINQHNLENLIRYLESKIILDNYTKHKFIEFDDLKVFKNYKMDRIDGMEYTYRKTIDKNTILYIGLDFCIQFNMNLNKANIIYDLNDKRQSVNNLFIVYKKDNVVYNYVPTYAKILAKYTK